MPKHMRAFFGAALLAASIASSASAEGLPTIAAKRSAFFVGGAYSGEAGKEIMRGQMYVEYQIPFRRLHKLPIVMFSGGGQSGLNYSGTPDSRPGFRDYFLRQGYAVYLCDQPSRARSPHQAEVGKQSRHSTARVEQQFTA